MNKKKFARLRKALLTRLRGAAFSVDPKSGTIRLKKSRAYGYNEPLKRQYSGNTSELNIDSVKAEPFYREGTVKAIRRGDKNYLLSSTYNDELKEASENIRGKHTNRNKYTSYEKRKISGYMRFLRERIDKRKRDILTRARSKLTNTALNKDGTIQYNIQKRIFADVNWQKEMAEIAKEWKALPAKVKEEKYPSLAQIKKDPNYKTPRGTYVYDADEIDYDSKKRKAEEIVAETAEDAVVNRFIAKMMKNVRRNITRQANAANIILMIDTLRGESIFSKTKKKFLEKYKYPFDEAIVADVFNFWKLMFPNAKERTKFVEKSIKEKLPGTDRVRNLMKKGLFIREFYDHNIPEIFKNGIKTYNQMQADEGVPASKRLAFSDVFPYVSRIDWWNDLTKKDQNAYLKDNNITESIAKQWELPLSKEQIKIVQKSKEVVGKGLRGGSRKKKEPVKKEDIDTIQKIVNEEEANSTPIPPKKNLEKIANNFAPDAIVEKDLAVNAVLKYGFNIRKIGNWMEYLLTRGAISITAAIMLWCIIGKLFYDHKLFNTWLDRLQGNIAIDMHNFIARKLLTVNLRDFPSIWDAFSEVVDTIRASKRNENRADVPRRALMSVVNSMVYLYNTVSEFIVDAHALRVDDAELEDYVFVLHENELVREPVRPGFNIISYLAAGVNIDNSMFIENYIGSGYQLPNIPNYNQAINIINNNNNNNNQIPDAPPSKNNIERLTVVNEQVKGNPQRSPDIIYTRGKKAKLLVVWGAPAAFITRLLFAYWPWYNNTDDVHSLYGPLITEDHAKFRNEVGSKYPSWLVDCAIISNGTLLQNVAPVTTPLGDSIRNYQFVELVAVANKYPLGAAQYCSFVRAYQKTPPHLLNIRQLEAIISAFNSNSLKSGTALALYESSIGMAMEIAKLPITPSNFMTVAEEMDALIGSLNLGWGIQVGAPPYEIGVVGALTGAIVGTLQSVTGTNYQAYLPEFESYLGLNETLLVDVLLNQGYSSIQISQVIRKHTNAVNEREYALTLIGQIDGAFKTVLETSQTAVNVHAAGLALGQLTKSEEAQRISYSPKTPTFNPPTGWGWTAASTYIATMYPQAATTGFLLKLGYDAFNYFRKKKQPKNNNTKQYRPTIYDNVDQMGIPLRQQPLSTNPYHQLLGPSTQPARRPTSIANNNNYNIAYGEHHPPI